MSLSTQSTKAYMLKHQNIINKNYFLVLNLLLWVQNPRIGYYAHKHPFVGHLLTNQVPMICGSTSQAKLFSTVYETLHREIGWKLLKLEGFNSLGIRAENEEFVPPPLNLVFKE